MRTKRLASIILCAAMMTAMLPALITIAAAEGTEALTNAVSAGGIDYNALYWPVDHDGEYYWITSLDVYNSGKAHGSNIRAIDIFDDTTGTIYAIADGKVVTRCNNCSHSSNWAACEAAGHKGLGNYLVIEHSDGSRSTYAHLLRDTLTTKTEVKAGEKIAMMGSSGCSTGRHLHFCISNVYAFEYYKNRADLREKFIFKEGLASRSPQYGAWISDYYKNEYRSASGNKYWAYSGGLENIAPVQTEPLTISAVSNTSSGTTEDRYAYTVSANMALAKVTYSFNGNSKLYTLNANGSNNCNSGTTSVSADKRTWTWSDDVLGAGDRTIIITAYTAGGDSASATLNISVSAPAKADELPEPLTVSASSNLGSGTTEDRYAYTVSANMALTKVTYSFNGNSKLYTLNADSSDNFNSGSSSVSSDRRTWTWSGDVLGAGDRTITITAYSENGDSASATLNITVSVPAEAEELPEPFTVNASSNLSSGTTEDRYAYTVTTSIPAVKITYSFSGNSKLYTLNADGSNNFNSGSSSVSSDRRTWTWSGDILGAGDRTITITAYDDNGNTAETTLSILVERT